MALKQASKALLDNCADAIASGEVASVDLSRLRGDRSFISEAPLYLAEQVEERSGHQYTVRPADPALFAYQAPGGLNCYMVRCAFSTPKDEVTELTGDMFLVGVSPSQNGFQLRAEAALPEKVTSQRAYAAEEAAQRQTAKRAEAAVEADRKVVVAALQQLAGQESEEITALLGPDPTISAIAEICHRYDLPLLEFFKAALAPSSAP